MSVVTVRNIQIGRGVPKICLPLVASSREEIFREAKNISDLPFDLAEWRCDWYEGIFEEGPAPVLEGLRQILGDKPILCTFRTKEEGGAREASSHAYRDLAKEIISCGLADLADLELLTLSDSLREMTALAEEAGVATIISSHDFAKTPPKEEMLRRLRRMVQAGGDIAKIAVMPNSPKDVLDLLEITWEFSKDPGNIPLITMSMGALGCVSRLCGQTFGSALTFGSGENASAPGQIPAADLKRILDLLGS